VLDVGLPGLGGEPALELLRRDLEAGSVPLILQSGEHGDALQDLAAAPPS